MAEEGVFIISQSREPSAGAFQPPIEFDKKNFVGNWVLKGSAVDAAKGTQAILGTQYGSVGWAVWQYPKEHRLAGRPAEVATKNSGTYIFMFRPKRVQEQVNAIYGNVSKQHLIRETGGQTIGGQRVTDPGILSDERIREQTGIKEFGGDEPQIQMNTVNSGSRVEAPPVATAEVG